MSGDSMILLRALPVSPCRPSFTPHRRFFRVSMPSDSLNCWKNIFNYNHNGLREEVGGYYGRRGNPPGQYAPGLLRLLDRDSCGYGFGYDYQCEYKNDMGGRPCYAYNSPHDRFLSAAYPVEVSDPYDLAGMYDEPSDGGNIQRYSSSPGIIRKYPLNAGNMESIGLDHIDRSEVMDSCFDWESYLYENTGETRLVEVFSIRIMDYENTGYIYGTIQFDIFEDRLFLYKRPPSDPELVIRDGTLSLTGPNCCLRANSYFVIQFNLKDKEGNADPLASLYRQEMGFHFDCDKLLDDGLYDTQMKLFHCGKSASMMMYYSVFYNAVQAMVDIDIVKGEDEDRVYGRVVARYSNYDYSTDEQKKYFQSVLFDKSENNYVNVDPEMPIPLSKYMVAVPTTSFLIIETNLWNHNETKPDDQIAKGTVMFQPKTDGATTKDIVGVSGRVEVTVTWSAVFI